MARTAPGDVAQGLPEDAARGAAADRRDLRHARSHDRPRPHPLRAPALLRLLPDRRPLSSMLGDFLSTGLGALGLTWQSAPALTEVEEVTTDWVRQMVGLSPAWRGVIQDTASTATLVALRLRPRAGLRTSRSRAAGLQGPEAPLVVYASAPEPQLGAEGGADRRLRPRRTSARSTTDAEPRDAAGSARRGDARGSRPRLDAVRGRRDVGLDDAAPPSIRSRDLAPSRAEHGAWVHVDAAMAGSAMVLDGMPAALARRRRRRLARAEPAQVARRDLRLLALPGARSRAPRAGDEHEPDLPAVAGRGRGHDLP